MSFYYTSSTRVAFLDLNRYDNVIDSDWFINISFKAAGAGGNGGNGGPSGSLGKLYFRLNNSLAN